MTALARLLILIPAGYVLALAAAGMVAAAGVMGIDAFMMDMAVSAGLTIGFMFYAGMISFIPAAIAILLAELMNGRSILIWLAVGGGIGYLNGEATLVFDGLTFVDSLRLICVAAGFAGGFVYWAVAGRQSGLMRDTPPGATAV